VPFGGIFFLARMNWAFGLEEKGRNGRGMRIKIGESCASGQEAWISLDTTGDQCPLAPSLRAIHGGITLVRMT
jgi:hypothetical protein